jgi:hypothetical protein
MPAKKIDYKICPHLRYQFAPLVVAPTSVAILPMLLGFLYPLTPPISVNMFIYQDRCYLRRHFQHPVADHRAANEARVRCQVLNLIVFTSYCSVILIRDGGSCRPQLARIEPYRSIAIARRTPCNKNKVNLKTNSNGTCDLARYYNTACWIWICTKTMPVVCYTYLYRALPTVYRTAQRRKYVSLGFCHVPAYRYCIIPVARIQVGPFSLPVGVSHIFL